ncbi:response regulator [Anaeromyxobacter terrae]|uniref:response regulator n=1 Tax=Anaeromyxobacter terrae TaxID=2925406 RepID=UPI001F59A326|nr:response regulator [Anaeromyxobacter sp. SG22]
MLKPTPRESPAFLALLALGLLAVLGADAVGPRGSAEWALYAVPVALALLARTGWTAIAVAAGATVLLAIGYVVSPAAPAGLPAWLPLTNRAIGFVMVWVVALIVRASVRARMVVAREQWTREGMAAVRRALQGDKPVEAVGADALRALANHLGAEVGALHVQRDDGRFHPCATLAGEPGAGASFAPGEGLSGEVAVAGRVRLVNDVPAGYLRITSGAGGADPRALVLAPSRVDDEVIGVVELGAFRAFDDLDVEVLDRIAQPLGIALRSARDRARLEELLAETQRQAERLEIQQEELRVANEELQSQADVLRDSQARLEAQQAELEQANVQLEEQAATLEDQRAQLAERGEELEARAHELERASRFKSEFLANMSHELRTPLNSALILAKLLSENAPGNLTEEQVRYARTIHQSGTDLLVLINDILDLSKIEAGRLEVHPEAVPVARLVEQLALTFGPVASERGLAFERVVEAGAPPELTTDPQRLLQVMQNLLSNAFKFTERGGVTLRVSPAPDDHVALVVQDTGIGIPEEKQRLVFEAFRQADGTTSRRYGGTGLGLSIARELVALLGGTLSLESAPGRGSAFTVTLPRAIGTRARERVPLAAQAPATAAAVPASVPASRAPAVLRAMPPAALAKAEAAAGSGPAPARVDGARRVLVIEDDPAFAEVLCGLARERLFACELATTASAGLERAFAEPPEAIVLDVGLPDLSGLAVLDQLKRDPRTRHVPVHVMSVEDYTHAALEMGAVGYALKPVKRDELLEAFEKLEERLRAGVRRILVVEDDPVQRESLSRLLSGRDVETVGASTVADAVAKLQGQTFDCVVMDLALPDGSGFDLLERMAASEGSPFPPVIVYTGRSLDPDEEQRLRRYSRSIIVKGARSPERLLDEVTLFLHQVEAELPPERRRMLQVARSREAVFEGRRVLVVEDDVRNVFALAALLEARGAVVDIARNGREALEVLARAPRTDLVLMDIMMPEMDGYEAMRRIRADARLAKLPIIALTARAMADDRQRCLDAGANDYVSKPIDLEKLLSLMRVWMPR